MTRPRPKLGTIAIAVYLLATPAAAAEFTHRQQANGPDVIAISGVIYPGDDKKFLEITWSLTNAIVILNSRGGNLNEAAIIGRRIRSHNWETRVRNGAVCNSACTLIWVAGVPRSLDLQARLGFHSAATPLKPPTRSEAGNRAWAAYLAEMGVPQQLIDLQPKADPCCLKYVDHAQAKAWGLLSARSAKQQALPPPKVQQPAATRPAWPTPVVRPVTTSPELVPEVRPVTTSPELVPQQALPTPATQHPAAPLGAPAPVSSKPPVRGRWMIQVGTYPSEQAAKERLFAVQRKAPEMLIGTERFIEAIEKGGTTYYRVRFAGLDKDKAEAACEYLKRNDLECVIVNSQERDTAHTAASGCAEVTKTPAGFLNLRSAPMMGLNVIGRLRSGDRLFVDTATCEVRGKLSICTESGDWTHVEAVQGDTKRQGWVASRFVRSLECKEEVPERSHAGVEHPHALRGRWCAVDRDKETLVRCAKDGDLQFDARELSVVFDGKPNRCTLEFMTVSDRYHLGYSCIEDGERDVRELHATARVSRGKLRFFDRQTPSYIFGSWCFDKAAQYGTNWKRDGRCPIEKQMMIRNGSFETIGKRCRWQRGAVNRLGKFLTGAKCEVDGHSYDANIGMIGGEGELDVQERKCIGDECWKGMANARDNKPTLANPAAAQNAERDMTCIGSYRGERVGYCHLLDTDNLKGGELLKKPAIGTFPA